MQLIVYRKKLNKNQRIFFWTNLEPSKYPEIVATILTFLPKFGLFFRVLVRLYHVFPIYNSKLHDTYTYVHFQIECTLPLNIV